MNVTTHIRNGSVIRTLPQSEVVNESGKITKPAVAASTETFKSINQAKRASRELQRRAGVVLRAQK